MSSQKDDLKVKQKILDEVGDGVHPLFNENYEKNLYDAGLIIGENPSSFITNEQSTMELKFIDGKLHQKILITNYGATGESDFISEKWIEVEGQ